MTPKQIISDIESMLFYYNEETQEAYDFWTEAVKKCPEFVKKDIQELRELMKEVGEYDDELTGDFIFSAKYGEILKPLGLDIIVE